MEADLAMWLGRYYKVWKTALNLASIESLRQPAVLGPELCSGGAAIPLSNHSRFR
jgi:hypothetical protein